TTGTTTSARTSRTVAVALAGGADVAGVAWATGTAFGYRGPAFAWVLHFLLMGWSSGVLDAARPRLTSSYFRVRDWEPAGYRRLGAWWYLRLLRAIGWERLMRGGRGFTGTRVSLAVLDRQTRSAECGHLVVAVVVTAVSVVAAAAGAWDAVAWLSGLTVLLHLFPVLLQRALRARIQRLRSPGKDVSGAYPRGGR
ncbi:hypothetical protein AB0C29_47400, partial [Actinoplanes sp. NPDC048791]|uniref:glycosyl-4,4'-diaponeurosporenoate acyltransferase CrtO family protein n=1 Tax=Actinoplanes sp. NPDC048791 TaxID=3154623 RepID=UPI0033EEA8B1